MIKFNHVYVIQKKEVEDFLSYTATLPALPNVLGVADTPENAISALRSALISVLRDLENEKDGESELPTSLESGEIIGFGILEATSDDELPDGEEDEG